MTQHSENCSSAAAYAERVFQQLEDNRPSDAPDDFSDPSPEKPTPSESKTTGKSNQSQPVRSNTVGSPDVHAQSKTGKSTVKRACSVGHGHVQQLIASYEARSRRTEDLAQDMAHREREVAAAGRAPPQARTSAVQQETPFFCPACIADDEKEWIRAVEADADS
ncbi:hypothetical protein LY78DRAFT_677280 [Colletotrichum sublineola]|uniref:Uncharacterized protein n=1 Tax=Colletotrichum sublineola TaxID=1173701 RepID=A0A066WYC9_COLSU|nr:hypothetical protein LY78DRAFT_677280 [Colletotrichum sublineola]KDN61908.1 hypothetical protein CSUB01_07560 [Colletotrichum sublineola]